MSYEGYTLHQCALGHTWEVDAFKDYFETKPICPQCKGLAVWSNCVDQTNGSYDDNTGERIDGYIDPPIPEFHTFPKIPRLSRDCIITEKIDGTNAQIYITEDNKVFAGSRSRWLSPAWEVEGRDGKIYTVKKSDDNYGFAVWVEANKEDLIKELGLGRHFGEWWGKGIGRGYGLDTRRFSLFNVSKWATIPLTLCNTVPILYEGPFDSRKVVEVLETLKETGSMAAQGYMNPEGIVLFHSHSKHLYKKTIKNDDRGKE